MFSLPPLPYAYGALAPVISERTMRVHHDKHHATYVKTLNELLAKSGERPRSLEEVILEAGRKDETKVFNNAAQAWNHAFFWTCMTPDAKEPHPQFATAVVEAFGGMRELKAAFVEEGFDHFASGWVWLAAEKNGRRLVVLSTHDADNLVARPELTPLLVCDLWEHAYYLDHQNDRKAFLEAWFDALPDWGFAAGQLRAACGEGDPWRFPAPG